MILQAVRDDGKISVAVLFGSFAKGARHEWRGCSASAAGIGPRICQNLAGIYRHLARNCCLTLLFR